MILKPIRTTFTAIVLLALAACNHAPQFKIQGVVSGADQKMIYLEHQGLGTTTIIDSVELKGTGKFAFAVDAPEYPDFYRLRLDKQLIPFSIDSTETLTLQADAQSFATSYTVDGSQHAKQIKEVWLSQLDANISMSKLVREYNDGRISFGQYSAMRDSVLAKYKSFATKYIYDAPTSPVAYFALFQQIDNNLIFNPYEKKDSRAFAAVANVYNTYYPESERTKHLYNLALRSMAVVRQQERANKVDSTNLIAQKIADPSTKVIGYFDIDLPDEKGNMVKLSEIAAGHYTLLAFSTMGADWSAALNQQLHQLYDLFGPRGLRIYQVGLDNDPHIWSTSVKGLPWTNVQEREATFSQYVGLYNLTSVPQLFLLSAEGNIIMRVMSMEQLTEFLNQSL